MTCIIFIRSRLVSSFSTIAWLIEAIKITISVGKNHIFLCKDSIYKSYITYKIVYWQVRKQWTIAQAKHDCERFIMNHRSILFVEAYTANLARIFTNYVSMVSSLFPLPSSLIILCVKPPVTNDSFHLGIT